MPIKLLTFDLDNTLWDVESIVTRAEKVMRAWIRSHHPEFSQAFDFDHFVTLREAVLRERLDIAHNLTELRLEVLRRAFKGAGYEAAAAEAAAQQAFEEYFRERNVVEFFPGAIEALRALREDYDIYALSNGNADIQRIGLSHLFSRHFSAISVGAAKPDPRIYEAAIAAAAVEPGEVIHIGDHPVQDVDAAARVGMKTVWVNFGGAPWPDLPRPDGEIRHFDELPSLVRVLSEREID
ncbi:MAG TPA: HAD family hydrolase [Moraxellaceae bacterium]|nr:HAD family hydrolase [Moraxellaceae bacterium]